MNEPAWVIFLVILLLIGKDWWKVLLLGAVVATTFAVCYEILQGWKGKRKK